MAPVGGEYFLGIGLIRRSAVNAIGYFTGDFAGFIADEFEQGDDGFDFVGSFGLVTAVYWQVTDFFWVWQVLVSCPTTLMMWT